MVTWSDWMLFALIVLVQVWVVIHSGRHDTLNSRLDRLEEKLRVFGG